MNKRLEEILAGDPALREIYARRPAATRKPNPRTLLLSEVSQKFAEDVKANPGNVRHSVSGPDNTVRVERPRRTEVFELSADELTQRKRQMLDNEMWARYHASHSPPLVQRDYDPIKRFEDGFRE